MTNEEVKFTFEDDAGSGTRIKVFVVGGGGCNAVNRMIEDWKAVGGGGGY